MRRTRFREPCRRRQRWHRCVRPRAARALVPDGYVYSTEVDLRRPVDHTRVRRGSRLDNVTTLEARTTKTGLPSGCCDGVFLRRVYHHLTDPDTIAAELLAVVRPGGRLVIIDFEQNRWLSLLSSVEGLPESRWGDHGVQPRAVVDELTATGSSSKRAMTTEALGLPPRFRTAGIVTGDWSPDSRRPAVHSVPLRMFSIFRSRSPASRARSRR